MTPMPPVRPGPRDLLDPENEGPFLSDDVTTWKKVAINLRRNKKQDHTEKLDAAAGAFAYDEHQSEMWNPERFSLCWGTPIWDQSSDDQKVLLNQLYWVAYYSQIISAEIATIYFNQTSAAGLYGIEEFRPVCDMLDLESSQERAHIAAFKKVSEQVEATLFGERLFSYPMRGPFDETMIFQDSGPFRRWWKRLQLRAFGLLSSSNAFIANQYFLVRGLRTLNGKIVQHQLSQHYTRFDRPHDEGGQDRPKGDAPLPSQISYFHFCDESYHFNSSTILSHDVVCSLPRPTAFEKRVVNLGVLGCQRDHRNFSTMVAGIFWYDPAAFPSVYKVLRSPAFGLDDQAARELMRQSFCEENESFHHAFSIHTTARESYERYLEPLPFITDDNKKMAVMKRATIEGALARNRRELGRRLKGVTPPRIAFA